MVYFAAQRASAKRMYIAILNSADRFDLKAFHLLLA